MDLLITFFIGAVGGFTAGILVYRKHAEKLKAFEADARKKAEAVKDALR